MLYKLEETAELEVREAEVLNRQLAGEEDRRKSVLKAAQDTFGSERQLLQALKERYYLYIHILSLVQGYTYTYSSRRNIHSNESPPTHPPTD